MGGTLTLTGNGDFNGDLDVDGTTNLDNVDIDGTVDISSTLTVGGVTTLNGKFLIDGSNNDLMTFRTTGDTSSQVLGLQFQNNSEAVTAQIFGTGDNSTSGVFRIKGIGSVELHGGDVAVSGDATNMLKIDANGHVTIPNQPAFQAQPTGDNNNVTGDATTFSVVNVGFTEIFDQNGDFNHDDGTNRGKFTAPVTGRYLLGISCFFSGVTSASTSGVVAIATSNRTYNRNLNPYNVANVGVNGNYNFCILADMDANDTANFSLYVNGNGAKVVDLAGSQSTFYGHLVC